MSDGRVGAFVRDLADLDRALNCTRDFQGWVKPGLGVRRHARDLAGCGREALAFGAPGPERGVDGMR
jgi:hypothetical protein